MTRKRIALLYLGVVVTTLLVTALVLERSGLYRGIVEDLLARVLVRERFEVGDANLHLGDGRVVLDRFHIKRAPGDSARPLLAVDRVELDVDTNALGDFGRIRQVRLDGLHLDLDLSDGQAPDLASILRQAGADTPREGGPMPAISIVNSRVSLHFAPDAEPIEFTDVALQLAPESAGSRKLGLTGSMTSPAGRETVVLGSGDAAQQTFRAVLRIADITLDSKLAARFAPALADLFEVTQVRGAVDQLEIWIDYDGAAATLSGEAARETFRAGAHLDVRDLHGSPPGIQYPLAFATAEIHGTTEGGGTVTFEVRDEAAHGTVQLQGRIAECFSGSPQVTAVMDAKGMLIGPNLRDAVCSHRIPERFWRAFEPTAGRVDARLMFATRGADAVPLVELDLVLDDVTANWRGIPVGRTGMRTVDFPEPLRHVRGRVQVRADAVTVDEVTVEACGASATLTATIPTDVHGMGVFELRTDEVPFSDRLRAALGAVLPAAVEHYDDYEPTGSAAAHVVIRGERDDRLDVSVELRPLGASAAWRGFPYRMHDLRGRIDIDPLGVAFDLTGARGDARAAVHGRFRRASPDDAEVLSAELWLSAKDASIDTGLVDALGALSPQIARGIDFLAPGGTADCELTLWRAPGASEPSYDVRIDARDLDIELATLPLPIRSIRGPLFLHGSGSKSRIDIGVVEGVIDNSPGQPPARILVQGTVETGERGPRLDIVSAVRGLELNERLRDALDHDATFSKETWDVLRPSGFVNVIARQFLTPDTQRIRHELDIDLAGAASHAEVLPTPATQIQGEVTVRDEVATFRGIRCRMSGAEVHCPGGSARHIDDHSLVEFTVTADDFPIDESLANLFTGPLRETYLERNLRGRGQVHRLDLSFRFPDAGDSFSVEVAGRFGVRATSLRVGAEISDVVGQWRIEPSRIDETGGIIEGAVESAGFSAFGQRVHGVQFRFRADQDRFELRESRGRLHNGEVFGLDAATPDLIYDFADEGRLRANLGWRDLSLSSLITSAGAERAEYRGNLSGALHLEELIGSDVLRARGKGEVHVSEGNLGEVPLFTAIYSHLAPQKRPRFDGVSLDFEFGDRVVQIPDVELRSSLVSVRGSGRVTMDGYIDMEIDFADLFGRDADWLVLPTIARFLTTGVVSFQVYGFLRAPKARPKWLWESKADRVPLGPIPARDR